MAEQTLRESLEQSVKTTEAPAQSTESVSSTPSDQSSTTSPGTGEPASPYAPPPGETPSGETPTGGTSGEVGETTDEPPAGELESQVATDRHGRPLRGAAAAAAKSKQERAAAIEGSRAPESWRKDIRDKHWNTLPPAVQGEILRRETQVNSALRSSAEARKFQEDANILYESYKDVFDYEAAPPTQTLMNVMGALRALRFAQPTQKAQLMAQFVQGFGVDVQMLDQALAYLYGNSPQQSPTQGVEQVVAQQLAPVHQYISQREQAAERQRTQRQQQIEYNLQVEVDKFAADPANEYFEQLREDMANIMEASANRGQRMTLSEAYQRAATIYPDIYAEFARKQAARAGAAGHAAAQKAGLSVTGAPGGGVAGAAGATTLRGALEAAVARVEGRR